MVNLFIEIFSFSESRCQIIWITSIFDRCSHTWWLWMWYLLGNHCFQDSQIEKHNRTVQTDLGKFHPRIYAQSHKCHKIWVISLANGSAVFKWKLHCHWLKSIENGMNVSKTGLPKDCENFQNLFSNVFFISTLGLESMKEFVTHYSYNFYHNYG